MYILHNSYISVKIIETVFDQRWVPQEIKGLFEATTILHDEVHASVKAEKMKMFSLCSKNKFLFFGPLFKPLNLCPDSAIQ